jgi:hypothetical protein
MIKLFCKDIRTSNLRIFWFARSWPSLKHSVRSDFQRCTCLLLCQALWDVPLQLPLSLSSGRGKKKLWELLSMRNLRCLNSRKEDWCFRITFWKYWVKVSSSIQCPWNFPESDRNLGHFRPTVGPGKGETLTQYLQNVVRTKTSFLDLRHLNLCHRVALSNS